MVHGDYDYLCPSDGFPPYKNEERKKRLWILDGWNEQEAVQYLAHVMKSDHRDANREEGRIRKARTAYWLCGGSIRDMRDAYEDKELVTSRLEGLVGGLDGSAVELTCMRTEQRNTGQKNPDRIRTLFWLRNCIQNPTKRMRGVQVVDSGFIMNHLRRQLDVDQIFEAYVLAKDAKQVGPEDCFFELLIHRIVAATCQVPRNDADRRLPNVHAVRWAEGKSWNANMEELRTANEYWIPSVSDFPRISSAIVSRNTLYAFQMSTLRDLAFTMSMYQEFEQTVRRSESFPGLKGGVVVYVVRPTGTSFAVPADVGNLTFRPYKVDTTSIASIASSLRQLFEF